MTHLIISERLENIARNAGKAANKHNDNKSFARTESIAINAAITALHEVMGAADIHWAELFRAECKHGLDQLDKEFQSKTYGTVIFKGWKTYMGKWVARFTSTKPTMEHGIAPEWLEAFIKLPSQCICGNENAQDCPHEFTPPECHLRPQGERRGS